MASGETLAIFAAVDAAFPSSNYPQFSTRNNHRVLNFDPTTAETCYFEDVFPRNYSGGGITVYIHHAAASATSGTIGWLVALERIGDRVHDIDSDSFASDATLTAVTVSGTSGEVDIVSVNIADGSAMDSLAVGEGYRLRITRDTTNDTATGDAQLLRVEIVEQ